MAHFLFIDESGHDHHESPYEVLAGISVEEQDLWNLIQALQAAEITYFGTRYSDGVRELKGKKLLKRKTYRHASMLAIPEDERTELAKQALENPRAPTRRGLAALAQAKIAYVAEVMTICARYRCNPRPLSPRCIMTKRKKAMQHHRCSKASTGTVGTCPRLSTLSVEGRR